jgi:hypothetical protein
MKPTAYSIAVALLTLGALSCRAQSADDQQARLAKLPRRWVEPMHRITFAELLRAGGAPAC